MRCFEGSFVRSFVRVVDLGVGELVYYRKWEVVSGCGGGRSDFLC